MMTTTKLNTLLVPVAVAMALTATQAVGGIITGAQSATGPGLGLVSVPVINSFSPNNDNAGANSNNIAVAVKRFDNPGYIDIEFNFSNSLGVSEYEVFEAVDNNTGTPWSSYQMQLGYGVGASFVPSASGDGLDFDDPNLDPAPTTTAFSSVNAAEDVLLFSGGLHSSGLQTYRFRIDVPDAVQGRLGDSFTLRQIPTPVPEPSALILALSAVAGRLLRRRCSRGL